MKIRTLIYIVILLLIVNVAALSTMVYYRVSPPRKFEDRKPRIGMAQDDVSRPRFSKEEREFIEQSRRHLDSLVAPVVDQIEQRRDLLLDELKKADPDTLLVFKLIDEIGVLQSSVQKQMASQLIADRESFGPEQRRHLLKMIEERGRWHDRGFPRGKRLMKDSR